MAEDHWVLDDEVADPPFNPVVDIAAADAGVVYGYEDIVGRLNGGFGLLLELDIKGFVEDE